MEHENDAINIFDFDGTLTTETWPKFWVWVKKFGYNGEQRNDNLEKALAEYRKKHVGNDLETFFGFFNDLLVYNNEMLTYEELMEGEQFIQYNTGVTDFIKNTETGVVVKATGPIRIGRNCWLNPGTVVAKNAVLPDYTITGRNSLVNKDYSAMYASHAFITGAPAKPVSYNVQRIFSNKKERELRKYFEENENQVSFQASGGTEDDPYEEIVPMFSYNY